MPAGIRRTTPIRRSPAFRVVFTTPVVVWNAEHQWVSLRHVATQTGANDTGGWARGNLLEFIGAQFGIVNPMIAVMMGGAVVTILPVFVAFLFLQRYYIQGIMTGSVKG